MLLPPTQHAFGGFLGLEIDRSAICPTQALGLRHDHLEKRVEILFAGQRNADLVHAAQAFATEFDLGFALTEVGHIVIDGDRTIARGDHADTQGASIGQIAVEGAAGCVRREGFFDPGIAGPVVENDDLVVDQRMQKTFQGGAVAKMAAGRAEHAPRGTVPRKKVQVVVQH